ncbi:hypothetical protein OPV22_017900 [Ensete ventricosum]|uniref:F-box domain-containing protein n=1 Tax=Ensete ventricosum TaxID=4639 RepID=A0AAV8R0R6_ENSVE|nr:hypothetical protein OPV22_017900 [Ensete ventricosum]
MDLMPSPSFCALRGRGPEEESKGFLVENISRMLVRKQYRCTHSASCICIKGHLSEDAIYLVFRHLNWNPRLIALMSCVCKWFDEIAKRILWKEFCRSRAPKMMLDLQSCGSHSVDGSFSSIVQGAAAIGVGLFNITHIPGHFVYRTRFSRTCGKSFLIPQCRTDDLYVSDPCKSYFIPRRCGVSILQGKIVEHAAGKDDRYPGVPVSGWVLMMIASSVLFVSMATWLGHALSYHSLLIPRSNAENLTEDIQVQRPKFCLLVMIFCSTGLKLKERLVG